jgi:hypothetical protein
MKEDDHSAIEHVLADILARLAGDYAITASSCDDGMRRSCDHIARLGNPMALEAVAGVDDAQDGLDVFQMTTVSAVAAALQQLEWQLGAARAEIDVQRSEAKAYRDELRNLRDEIECLEASNLELRRKVEEKQTLLADSESRRWEMLKEWRRHACALLARFSCRQHAFRSKFALHRIFHHWNALAATQRAHQVLSKAAKGLRDVRTKMCFLFAWCRIVLREKSRAAGLMQRNLESDCRLQVQRQDRFVEWACTRLVQRHIFMLWKAACVRMSFVVVEADIKSRFVKQQTLRTCFNSWLSQTSKLMRSRSQALQISLRRWLGVASSVFRGWSQLTYRIRVARDCSTKAWRAVRNACLAKAYLAWNRWTRTGSEASAKLLHGIWRGWAEAASRRRVTCSLVAWLGCRRDVGLARSIITRWVRRIHAVLGLREKIHKWARRGGKKTLLTYFNSWARRKMLWRARALQDQRKNSVRLDVLRLLFFGWLRYMHASYWSLHRLSNALHFHATRTKARTILKAWRQQVNRASFLGRANERLAILAGQRCLSNCFRGWSRVLAWKAGSYCLVESMRIGAAKAQKYLIQWRRLAAAWRAARCCCRHTCMVRTLRVWLASIRGAQRRKVAGAVLGRLSWRILTAFVITALHRWLLMSLRTRLRTQAWVLIHKRKILGCVVQCVDAWRQRVWSSARIRSSVKAKRFALLRFFTSAWHMFLASRKRRHACAAQLQHSRRWRLAGSVLDTWRSLHARNKSLRTQAVQSHRTNMSRQALTLWAELRDQHKRLDALQIQRKRHICSNAICAMAANRTQVLRHKRHLRVCQGRQRMLRSSALFLAMSAWYKNMRDESDRTSLACMHGAHSTVVPQRAADCVRVIDLASEQVGYGVFVC